MESEETKVREEDDVLVEKGGIKHNYHVSH
jgi:hypothetical protein